LPPAWKNATGACSFEILFEESSELTWEEAESCIESLKNRQTERALAEVQRGIEANPAPAGDAHPARKKAGIDEALGRRR